MNCPACGAENPAEQKFCNECAAAFKKRCPKCDYENPPTAKFCGECAAALASSESKSIPRPISAPGRVEAEQVEASALEGERKTISVLFADIGGSMSQIEDLDPEAARAIVVPALAIMAEAVNRYQGHVAQSTGDGVFALFGYRSRMRTIHSARSTQQCGCRRSCGAIRTACAPRAKRRSRLSGSTPTMS